MENIFQSISLFITTTASSSIIVQIIIVFVLIIVLLKTLGKYGIIDIIVNKIKNNKKQSIDSKILKLENTAKLITDNIERLMDSKKEITDNDLEIITLISKLDISVNRMDETLKELKEDIKDRDTLREVKYKIDNIRDSAGSNW